MKSKMCKVDECSNPSKSKRDTALFMYTDFENSRGEIPNIK